jgi:hypothetical protein
MSRTPIAFSTADLSVVARSLCREISAAPERPGHVQMLNMLARSAGFRNFQHLRAEQAAAERLQATPAAEPVDHILVERVSHHFDAAGRMVRWPSRSSHRALALWVLWARIPAGEALTEKDVNVLLDEHHLFGDRAQLRRSLVEAGLMTRTRDCRDYRRVEMRPPPEARMLIRLVDARRN